MGQFIELQSADGHRFQAYVAQPAGKARGAIVIAPEIFGVNSHIRAVADHFAVHGYVALAPVMFDLVARDVQLGFDAESTARACPETNRACASCRDHRMPWSSRSATARAAAGSTSRRKNR